MSLPTMTAPPTAPTVSDDSATFNVRAFALVAWFATHVAEQALWASALPSVITGTDFSGTSTSSVLIGTGAKSFTTQTGKQFQIGQTVRVANTVAPENYMDGQVTAYNSGTGVLDVAVSSVGGSGTLAAWTISLVPGGAGDLVTLAGTQTLTNKTLTAPVIATISNGGTVTLPTGAVTLVARTTTDTLTNKTIDFAVGGNVGKINGNTLAASAGTATITFFNSSDTVVGRATTDTLTNKTLTSPTINGGTLVGATFRADCALNDAGTIAAASPGFRGVPNSGQSQGSGITFALADAGKMSPNTSGGWTIPANASIAFPVGTVLLGFNDSATPQNLSITTDTLRFAGSTSTGTRSVLAYGFFTAVKVGTTTWAVSGNLA